jgi:deoxyribonuclease (pyrimidine dimer)
MRCNCGVNPKYLTDSWLIAEQVELLMIPGMLRRLNYEPKSPIPNKFKMGTGHMLFWVNKIIYLKNRHAEVKKEVARRGFKVTDKSINLSEFPDKYLQDWKPNQDDTNILRERLIWKLNRKPNIWRYHKQYIVNIQSTINSIKNSELYFV